MARAIYWMVHALMIRTLSLKTGSPTTLDIPDVKGW